jgi:uncharacterized membrane protein
MAIIGRLHPLLIHFPIALALAAAAAESAAIVTGNGRWRTVAVANVRAAAAAALLAAIAGWRFAVASGIEATPLLEWHRWLGTMAAGATIAAALAASGSDRRSPFELWIYRIALFGAGTLVAAAGHLGGLLVWGTNFLRP